MCARLSNATSGIVIIMAIVVPVLLKVYTLADCLSTVHSFIHVFLLQMHRFIISDILPLIRFCQ